MLFQVAAILRPTQKEAEEGKAETLILEPRWKIAANDQVAAMLATREVDEQYADKMDRVAVLVRPF